MQAIETEVLLPVADDDAFATFVEQFGDWWPREFSWSGPELLQRVGIEPRVDGLLYELGPHGFRLDWGRVTQWDPPSRISFTWQIGPDRVPVPDPTRASLVDVRFVATESGTRILLQHDGWDRHGDDAERYRDDFADAWPHALSALSDLVDRRVRAS